MDKADSIYLLVMLVITGIIVIFRGSMKERTFQGLLSALMGINAIYVMAHIAFLHW